MNLSTSLLLSMAELGLKVLSIYLSIYLLSLIYYLSIYLSIDLSIFLLSHLLTRKGAVSQVNLDEAQLLVDLFDTNKDMEVVRYPTWSQVEGKSAVNRCHLFVMAFELEFTKKTCICPWVASKAGPQP